MDKPKAVLFDWDGTLYDSVNLCFEIYQELFKRFGAGPITFEEFRRDFSGDYHKYQAQYGLGPDKWGEFDSAWYEMYYEKQDKASLFSNSQETLRKLHLMKVPIGLVTNATKNRIHSELKHLGLRKYFSAVAVIEDANWEFKPSPKLIHIACESMGVSEKHALYIGDMADDVIAGKKAGAMTGAVGTGVHTIEKLAREEPDFIFADISEVPKVFA